MSAAAETDRMARPAEIEWISELACPHCRHRKTERMSANACEYLYLCAGCSRTLKPKTGDCCVFCSYGSHPCPPVQAARATNPDR